MVSFVASHVRLPRELDVLASKKIASPPARDVDLGGHLLVQLEEMLTEERG